MASLVKKPDDCTEKEKEAVEFLYMNVLGWEEHVANWDDLFDDKSS